MVSQAAESYVLTAGKRVVWFLLSSYHLTL